MDPINYKIDVLNPFQVATSGMQAGFGAINNLNALQDRQAQIEAQKQAQAAALAKQQQMNAVLQAHMQKPSYETATQIAALYPKDQAEQINKVFTSWEEGKQKNVSTNLMNIQAGLDSDTPEVGMDLLNKYEESLKNSGADPMQLEFVSGLKRIAEEKGARAASFALTGPLAHAIGVDKYSQYRHQMESARTTSEKRPYEVATAQSESFIKQAEAKNTPQSLLLKNKQTQAEINNIYSQIKDRADRFGLDQDKLRTDVEMKLYELGQKGSNLNLDAPAKTLINDSAIASASAEQSANQIDDLAAKIEKAGGGSGVFTSASEWLKKTTGNQDYMTQLRQEYTRVRNNQAIKMLPAGAASDKDIAMAMQGFPPDNADSATMAQFLKGMAKLNRYTAISENAKSEWVNAVGHLGKPKTDIEIDGIQVPAGMNFPKFASQYVTAKIGQKTQQAAQAELPNRSYMVHATGAQ